MKVIDQGHRYELQMLDGDELQTLTFVKREGSGYPGNVGSYPGTVIQEVLRCCIDRLYYVEAQIHHPVNLLAINLLRGVIYLLEMRASERHGQQFSAPFVGIEKQIAGKDGHLSGAILTDRTETA